MTRNQRMARMLRGLTGLSQGQFARKAGLNPNRVAAIEAGDLEPTAQDLQRIAAGAGMSAADADQLLRIGDWFSSGRQRQDQGALEALPALMDTLKQQLGVVFLRLLALPAPAAAPAAEDPAHVEDMMNRLRGRRHEVRVWAVRTVEELPSWSLCERVCDESIRESLRGGDLDRAVEWAELAQEIVQQLENPS